MIFGFISVARSDFGRLLPVMRAVQESDVHSLKTIVAGNHQNEKYGSSCNEIEASGFQIDFRIDSSDNPAESSAYILSQLYTYLKTSSIDYLVILGDRFEMLAAAQAATLARVPIIHIGGGYTTEGAFDNSIRDAITALSEYHLVATEKCYKKAARIVGNNEKIHLSGAPDLEIITKVSSITYDEFCKELGLNSDLSFVLVTLHPETNMDYENHLKAIQNFKKFLLTLNTQILLTAPCADPGSEEIFAMTGELVESKRIFYKENLGARLYINALRHTSLVLGNSSSGIIEAGSFRIPVVNVGDRQKGREQNINVINSTFDLDKLKSVYEEAMSGDFRSSLNGENIYGDCRFTEKFNKIFLEN